ncbi:MAG: SIR2 family NAD-dependent protein deacylase [Planctomycetota bacterium]|jgi:NAD-dependent deacetylase
MTDELSDNIRQVARLLIDARRVCCMTGAGVSAESGVPTFRGHDGLWEGRRPEEVATPEAFEADPHDVWRFYLWRRKALSQCRPNPGHVALARLEEMVENFTLITQNVDGLHRQAGSQHVLELHGNVWINRCTGRGAPGGQSSCPERRGSPDDGFEEIPHCPHCGSMIRPGVVWYGEMLPVGAFGEAQKAVGEPAASLASWAAASGATVVEVNPEHTPLSGSAAICLNGPSGRVLPAVVAQMEELNAA